MEKIKWSASHIITATVRYFTVTFYCKLNIWIDIQLHVHYPANCNFYDIIERGANTSMNSQFMGITFTCVLAYTKVSSRQASF